MNPAGPLPNQRHEAFSVDCAANGNAAKAWLQSGGRNRDTANRHGDKWRRKGDIAARVGWLRAEAERRMKVQRDAENESAVVSIEERRRFCADEIRASATALPDNSPLWAEIEVTPDRLRAASCLTSSVPSLWTMIWRAKERRRRSHRACRKPLSGLWTLFFRRRPESAIGYDFRIHSRQSTAAESPPIRVAGQAGLRTYTDARKGKFGGWCGLGGKLGGSLRTCHGRPKHHDLRS